MDTQIHKSKVGASFAAKGVSRPYVTHVATFDIIGAAVPTIAGRVVQAWHAKDAAVDQIE